MKRKSINTLLIALSSSLLVTSGLISSNHSQFKEARAESGLVTGAVEISDGSVFASTINNGYDGLFIRLTSDITYADLITVPENCFVTVEMNNHTVYYTSNESNNIGVKQSSTLMMQNGTWSGTFDTDDSDSGTIILNAFKQVLPDGEDDLTSDGTDCNAKGVIFAGYTKMWIVNGCDIHRIATEHGYINPGADTLNPWLPGRKDSSITEEHVAEKQPYDFENSAPAMVGSGSTWEIKATLGEDFTRAQTGGETYKYVILLKDASLTSNATLEASDKIFDLSGHELTLGGYNLNVTNNSGVNIIRNGFINGDIDFSVGTGEVELTSLTTSGQIVNNQHDITISNGYYGNIVTESGMIRLKSGYYYGTYTGDRFEMISGYYVNKPAVNQIALGSESNECSVVEQSITYNYTIVGTQPNKDNDYTAALNDTISGASFQWYKEDAVSVTPDETYIEYIEAGALVSPGVASTEYSEDMDSICVVLDFISGKVSEGDIITFKCDVEATTLFAPAGEVTSLGDSKYSYLVHTYYNSQFFAVAVSEVALVYDIEIIKLDYVPIAGETSARLSNSTLSNTKYRCNLYKDGVLFKTTNVIEPNAVSFVCETEGANGDNPETLYQLEGRSITLPSNPYTKTCYGFDGWYLGSTKINSDTYTVGENDVTLFAKLTFGSHTYSEDWSSNDTHHWHAATCEHTDEKSSYGEHDWDEGVVTTQPTEEAKGVKTYTCTVCSKTKTEDVAKLTHEKGQHHDATAPGCTTEGNVEYWDCKNCDKKLDSNGNVLDSIVVSPTGHTYSTDWSNDETEHWHAATCEHTDEKDSCATHSWDLGAITTQPTEETKGVKTYTCTVCGKTRIEDVAKLTHEKGDHHDAQAPTCTTKGNVEYWDCKNCSNKLDVDGNILSSITIDETGHSYSTDWSHNDTHHWHAATCEHTDEKSSYGEHEWDEGVVTTQPTESIAGSMKYTCQTCGATKNVEVAKLTHEKGNHHDATTPGCTTEGNVEYWDCKNCDAKLDADGNVIESIVVAPEGHSFVKIDAEEAQVGKAGHKEYYECTKCHEYYEDETGTIKIVSLDQWKAEGGNGYIAPLTEENNMIWLWIIPVSILILLGAYTVGYVFFYREGRLDDKAIRVIYKWLPRGNKNKEEKKE